MEDFTSIFQTLEWMLRDCGRHDILDLDKPMPGKGLEVDDEV